MVNPWSIGGACAARRQSQHHEGEAMSKRQQQQPAAGPRGGTTTRTATGMVKKNLWISGEEAERLRRLAFDRRVSEAALFRRGLAAVLDREVAP
jgi:hypothetical protein